MVTDFYPRLTAIVKNHSLCNRVVNEQAHVSLLLAGPGVIGTLTFAPLVIAIFYTSKFEGAIEILRWLCLGMTLRVISWPMGFIIVAKNAQNIFIFSEAAWTAVYLGLAWACVSAYGFKGAGIAFFGLYVLHALMVYVIVRKLSGFRCSAENFKTTALFLALIEVVFCSYYALPPLWAVGGGTLATLLLGVYSIQVLLNLISPEQIPHSVQKLLRCFRLVTSGPKESDDLEATVEETAFAAAVENKPLIGMKRLIFAFILSTVVVI